MINSVNNNITTPAISFKGIVHIVPDKGKPELLTKVVNAAVKRLKREGVATTVYDFFTGPYVLTGAEKDVFDGLDKINREMKTKGRQDLLAILDAGIHDAKQRICKTAKTLTVINYGELEHSGSTKRLGEYDYKELKNLLG